MKKTLKIFALILSVMLLLPSVVGAAGLNPENALDWFYQQHYILGTVNGYKTGGGSWHADYFSFNPSWGADGFGKTSPFGVLRSDDKIKAFMPVFEFHSLDRTKGDFNTKNLTALTPSSDGSKYLFQNGDTGFTIFNSGNDMYMHPGENTSPVLSFTAPYDGEYMWQLSVQREYMGNHYGAASNAANQHDGLGTGTIFRVYRDNELLERAYVNRASYHNITVTARLYKGQSFYLEVDPWNNDTLVDGVFIRYNKVTIEKFYDGQLDKEYDNTNETPLYSVGFISDLHTEFDIVNYDVPVVQSVKNAVEFLKNRGKVDVMLVGGDTISETWVNKSNANQLSKWTVDNMDDVIAGIDEVLGSATKNGENVLHVSGNHDSHVSFILNKFNSNTAGYEYLNSSDYYKYMLEGMGDADAKLRADDLGYGKSQFNDVLCYRYELNGMHFIGINQPYSEFFGTVNNPTTKHRTDDHFYFPAQIEWVAEQLELIPKNETVIILGHYNLDNFVLPSTYKSNNPDAYKKDGKVLDPKRMFVDTLENYPNAMYLYGHIHGGDDKTYVWYNTKEHIQIQGAEKQLADGSYATDGWLYMYAGIVNNATQSFFEDGFHKGIEPSPISQVKVIDFYNDHITINTYNVGDDTAVIGVEKLSSYTIKREMTQLNNYSGNGSGNVETPVEDPTAAGQIYVPTSLSDSNKGVYRFNLGINNVENDNFVLRAMHRLTNETVAINGTASIPSWDGTGTYYTHYDALGHPMFVVSQYNKGAFFDMTPNNADHIVPVVAFKANETAAYSFDADFVKLWSPKNDANAEGSYVTVDVMRSDGTLIKTVSPDGTKWNQQIDVSGSVYLREGEELWFVVRQADTNTSTRAYETALTYLNVVQHTSWEIDLEEIENNENKNPSSGNTGSTGGGNKGENPKTGAVSIAVAAAVMGSALTATVMMVGSRRRKKNV